MKKTFNRLLAATVAIPVALGQILAISATAANAPAAEITAKEILRVNPETGFPTDVTSETTEFSFEQVSTWNEYVKENLSKADGKTLKIDAKAIVGSLNSVNYYASLLKDFVEASENPTATVEGSTITVEGVANFAAYLVPELKDKFANMEGYENVELNASILQGVTYKAVVDADFDNKAAKAAFTFTADGKDYTVDTASEYLTAVYDNLSAQVDKAVADKAAQLAADNNMTADEVLANADFDIAGDKAALKEITDKLSVKIDALNKHLENAKKLTTAMKTYDSSDAALKAALEYAEKNGIAAAGNQPTTVDGMIAKFGGNFDTAVNSLNQSLTDADVNVQIAISAADIASVLNGATAVTTGANNGKVGAEFTIADEEAAAVEAYVEEQVAALAIDKEVDTVTTEKILIVAADANSAVATLDVVRNVTVTLKDKETTETTATEETGEGTETTANTDETGEGTETTANTDETGEGTETTANTDETGEGTETTANTDETGEGTETTASTEGTDGTDSTETTETSETLPDLKEVKSINVELLDAETSNGVYFSHDEAYDVADLIASVTITMNDDTVIDVADPAEAIGFLSTPSADYDSIAEDAGYFYDEIDIYYLPDTTKAPLPVHPTVAVALKGDTRLDGEVDDFDAYWTLMYNSNKAAGGSDYRYTFTKQDDVEAEYDVMLEKLAYMVSDINTESKAGKNTEDASIEMIDSGYNLMFNSLTHAGDKSPIAERWPLAIEGFNKLATK